MRKRIYAIVFMAFFILPLALSQADELFYTHSLILDINMKSDYTLKYENAGSKADYVVVNMQFFPLEGSNQEVLSIETDPSSQEKNDGYELKWEKPAAGEHEFSMNSKVKTYNKFAMITEKIPFPIKNLDISLEKYTKETEKADITPEVIAKASELASGEGDLYKILFN